MSHIALITGATSGIGKATATLLAHSGIHLIICGRRQEILDEMVAQLSKQVRVIGLCFDIRDKYAVEEAIASLSAEWRHIDILINNAGNAHGLGTIADGDTDDWDLMLDANVKGLLYVSRLIIPLMRARGQGHIVNLSSIAGKQTYANGVVYCASKAAVETISEGMRLELTPHGIKVTNIAPGAVDTDFSLVRFKGDEQRARQVYEGFDALKAEDIAEAIRYAVLAPKHVTIADMTILAAAQSAATTIHRK
ncbi:NADP-dependent 3-hydroxy acid dehydrogenase YdfG [Dyadobacter jejuensis]|uniref:NADP-dependent 3-hydroxy acid dehydrogenase YdfG n=1 Tax=Dyadobacter jejuensis TaxID=1082580 RepID=A0A316AQ41_9BACT|nr:SDR family NAD(P)-dependent oxidoreductase [Dyadobacter jejuensis]PWJ59885.1 NADP-dependent 3-hydroxy acid dehydrogenase YdfG [Dyadobacter jejuensis]